MQRAAHAARKHTMVSAGLLWSDVEIHRLVTVVLDELSARGNLVAHEQGEDGRGLGGVLHGEALQGTLAGVHGGVPQLARHHLPQPLKALDGVGPRCQVSSGGRQLALVVAVHRLLLGPGLHLVQRRHPHVHVARLEQLAAEAEQEGEQQGADVGAIHVSIRQDDHLAIAEALDGVALQAQTQADDQVADLVVGVHLLVISPLHVQDLAPQWQDGLELPVSRHLGTATCRVSLHQEDLGFGQIAAGAVAKLAGQRALGEHALTAHQVTRLLGSFRSTCSR
mmetsp:Transcript_5464/g.15621  ORF Transcript_5464/g.15621 Transcript_5464/m.15621 type:complete len:280 (+) Transcript_5464:1051-1890(+)